jgi:hypothetical protein
MAAIIDARDQLLHGVFFRPGSLAVSASLPVRQEQRVEHHAHGGLLVRIEQLRRFEDQLEWRIIGQSISAKHQLVTAHRQRDRQLAQYAERGLHLARFVEADLVGAHVQVFGQGRLGQSSRPANLSQIVAERHCRILPLTAEDALVYGNKILMNIRNRNHD